MDDNSFEKYIRSLRFYGENNIKKSGTVVMKSAFTGKPEIFTYKTYMEMIDLLEATRQKINKIKSAREALDKKMRDSGY